MVNKYFEPSQNKTSIHFDQVGLFSTYNKFYAFHSIKV